MREEKVIVQIDKKTGTVKIEADGFIGEGCSVLNDLEVSLGTRLNYQEKEERYQYLNPDILPVNIC
jgi:hypothetical protein